MEANTAEPEWSLGVGLYTTKQRYPRHRVSSHEGQEARPNEGSELGLLPLDRAEWQRGPLSWLEAAAVRGLGLDGRAGEVVWLAS